MSRERLIELGQRVKLIRKALHISQKDFAEKIDISGSYLSEIEAGKSKPGYDFFYNASLHCNINIAYILHGAGEMFTDMGAGPGFSIKEPGEQIESINEILWYIERSPIFKNTVMAFAAKFLFDNEKMMKSEVEKYNRKRNERNFKVL
jgi:transcriptional regulator with XRE-family HTH domain